MNDEVDEAVCGPPVCLSGQNVRTKVRYGGAGDERLSGYALDATCPYITLCSESAYICRIAVLR